MSQARLRVDYDQLLEARDYIQSQTSVKPEFGVICGSGLGGLAEQLDAEPAPRVISYSDIPHFPAVSVEGHAGNLVFGCFSGQPTVCMQGRFHCYEGYSVQQVSCRSCGLAVFKCSSGDNAGSCDAPAGSENTCSYQCLWWTQPCLQYRGHHGHEGPYQPGRDDWCQPSHWAQRFQVKSTPDS
jgi:hypothetical protein